MKKGRSNSDDPFADEPEPVQVYLSGPDRMRLRRLVHALGLSKSDVLRRGLEALEAQRARDAAPRVGPPIPTFRGTGLAPGVRLDNNAALLDFLDDADAAP